MPTTRVVAPLLLAAMLAAGAEARADRTKIARELAELALRKFAGAAAKEGAEALTKRIATAAAKHGDDIFDAVRKVGPRALSLANDAGEHAPRAIRFLTRHGDEAATLLAQPRAMRLFQNLGDDAGAAILRHAGVAEPLLESHGKAAAKALCSLGPRGGRRLAMLAEGDVGKLGKTAELMDLFARHGERACAFVWSNRGALAVAATMTAFLADPVPFIDGARSLGAKAVEGGTKVAEAAIEHAVAPAVAELSTQAAGEIPWGTLGIVGAVGLGGYLAWAALVRNGVRAARRMLATRADA